MYELQSYLLANRDIELVWVDYSCMPQRERNGQEAARELREEFKAMLPNINLIYIGCSVLVLADLSYVSRFWTQFECWLAMCEPSEEGLTGSATRNHQRRCDIRCIHNAPASFEKMLRELWSSKDWVEVYRVLMRPDVDVTNASDKTQQLPKIPLLNEAVKEIMIEQATKKERLVSQQGTEESAAKDGVDGEAESMDDSMTMMSMLGMGIPVPRMGRTSRVEPVEEVGVQEQGMPVEPVA